MNPINPNEPPAPGEVVTVNDQTGEVTRTSAQTTEPTPTATVVQRCPRFATVVIHLELTDAGSAEFGAAQQTALDEVLEQSPDDDAERIRLIDPAIDSIAWCSLAMEAAMSALETRQGASDAIEDAQQAADSMDPRKAAIVESDEVGNRVSVHLTLLDYSPLRKG